MNRLLRIGLMEANQIRAVLEDSRLSVDAKKVYLDLVGRKDCSMYFVCVRDWQLQRCLHELMLIGVYGENKCLFTNTPFSYVGNKDFKVSLYMGFNERG